MHNDFDESIGDHFEELYVTTYTTAGWTEARNAFQPINSANHDATVALSVDGENMIIYRDNELGIGNLYLVHKEYGMWMDPIPLPAPINSEESHETAGCFDPKMEYLYFVSDRPGGYGGKDIYRAAVLIDQQFGPPENLGPNINTSYDDDAVFLFGDDGTTMYFSSKGHDGMGGYDVYESRLVDSVWTKAENIGYPINSAADDVCFVRSSDSLYGYYSSSKPDSKGRYDIYQVVFNEFIVYPPAPDLYVTFMGNVTEEDTGEPLKAMVTATDVETGETFTFDESDECSGDYKMCLLRGRQYNIKIEMPGYLSQEEIVTIDDNSPSDIVAEKLRLRRLALGTKMVLANVFYDLNKATLSDSSYVALDKIVNLLKQYPDTRVEISAHTDSRGSADFNQRLSNARAKTCVEYLLSRGINENMLVARGYGENQLLMTDEMIEMLPDEERKEAAHQRNRRTEFKVIK